MLNVREGRLCTILINCMCLFLFASLFLCLTLSLSSLSLSISISLSLSLCSFLSSSLSLYPSQSQSISSSLSIYLSIYVFIDVSSLSSLRLFLPFIFYHNPVLYLFRSNREKREERSMFNSHQEDEDEVVQYNANVVIIKDEIAQIFKNSTRSKRTFPEFESGVAAAICLARYVQEPLAEYCALWKSANAVELFGFEALYLDVHPLKVIILYYIFSFLLSSAFTFFPSFFTLFRFIFLRVV